MLAAMESGMAGILSSALQSEFLLGNTQKPPVLRVAAYCSNVTLVLAIPGKFALLDEYFVLRLAVGRLFCQ
jgi:hypothetical protein